MLDEESARVAGLPVDTLNTLLAALTAVTIVAAMRVVGVLLVAALMVAPGRDEPAARACRSVRRSPARSLVGVVSVVVGLAAARQWELAPGGAIVLTAVAIFAVTAIVRRRASRGRRTGCASPLTRAGTIVTTPIGRTRGGTFRRVRLAGEKALVTGLDRRHRARDRDRVRAAGRDRRRHRSRRRRGAGPCVDEIDSRRRRRARSFAADLADEAACTELVGGGRDALGGLTVLVNNAAGGDDADGRVGDLTTDAWEAILRVDLTAPFWLCRAALPYLRARRRTARSSTSRRGRPSGRAPVSRRTSPPRAASTR